MGKIETFEAMLERGQDSEMLRYTLADACFKEQQFLKAVEHCREAVRLKPDYSAAWRLLGKSLVAVDQPQEALAAFDEGMRIAESNGDMQALKEMQVFRKRTVKQLDSNSSESQSTANGDSQ